MGIAAIRLLFFVAGVYDLAIGAAFLAYGHEIFPWAEVTPPNHMGYVQFAALLLTIFGLMFLAVAARPQANRNLIPYGVLLKVSYVGVVGYYWVTSGIPWLFQPFAVIDAVMLVLFLGAYLSLLGKAG